MKKVCFVCLGNICRSPMAEFIMKDLVQETDFHIESRGTSNWEHGNPIHPGTQKVLTSQGIPYQKTKKSQQVKLSDLDNFDYLLALDKHNYRDLLALSGGRYDDKIFLLRDEGVPDPYYTGDFEETYQLISQACQSWLDQLSQ